MFVKFFMKAVLANKTGDDGVPLFEDAEYVTIHRDSTHSMTLRVTDEHRERFPDIYAKFQRSLTDYEKIEGYPLEMWAALTPAEIENCKAQGILSVQQLAKLPKSGKNAPPGHFQALAERARNFIELAGAGSGLTKEADELRETNDSLAEDLRSAKQRIKELENLLSKASEAA